MKEFSKESNDKFLSNILKERFSSVENSYVVKEDYEKFELKQACTEDLKNKLIKKYEDLGCTSSKFKERFGELNFKQAFIKNYFEQGQPRCCFCGRLLETTKNEQGDEYIIADIEHIFPKSKFPQFSLHPLNWAPSCKECNESIKRDTFFEYEPLEKFEIALDQLKITKESMHPLKLWEGLTFNFENISMKASINESLGLEAKEFLGFYGIDIRAQIIISRCYKILLNIIKYSDIRSPESLERLLENIASSNWHELNDGYSINNSPQIWQEFIEHILYDENKLVALWEEVKVMNTFAYNLGGS